jgi:hypothetical protein
MLGKWSTTELHLNWSGLWFRLHIFLKLIISALVSFGLHIF